MGETAQSFDEKPEQTIEDTAHPMTMCYGCDDQNKVQFKCTNCNENFCKECLISEHPQNKHICLNCDQITDDEDNDASYGSYEYEEESIEAIMAKAKAFDL